MSQNRGNPRQSTSLRQRFPCSEGADRSRRAGRSRASPSTRRWKTAAPDGTIRMNPADRLTPPEDACSATHPGSVLAELSRAAGLVSRRPHLARAMPRGCGWTRDAVDGRPGGALDRRAGRGQRAGTPDREASADARLRPLRRSARRPPGRHVRPSVRRLVERRCLIEHWRDDLFDLLGMWTAVHRGRDAGIPHAVALPTFASGARSSRTASAQITQAGFPPRHRIAERGSGGTAEAPR